MPVKGESTQALLGQQARDHDDAEHHRQQQIKKIVSRVDGADADADREQEKTRAFRRQAKRPPGREVAEL